MNEQEQKLLACELSCMSVFRKVIKTNTMSAFIAFLNTKERKQKRLELFGEFVYSLKEDNYCFSDFLERMINEDENAYVVNSAKGNDISDELMFNTEAELKMFSYLTSLSSDKMCESLSFEGYIPKIKNEYRDFVQKYRDRVDNIYNFGYGIFSSSKMFKVDNNTIIPLKSSDEISAESFIGYESERAKVFENTLSLIEGKPAANILLFGDAGTGKSSTVKACANMYYDKGLRLIELRKDQLLSLSYIMDKIADNPLKFIIFIDDLSFNKNDDSFSMLKAALEGSASAKAKNAVIYATSNRRHIVKESFSDRVGEDDVHLNDTVQELISLSDRFGITVYFEKPNKKLYLHIVHELCKRFGVEMDEKELDIKAEAFALNKGNRSPRAAEQFVMSLLR